MSILNTITIEGVVIKPVECNDEDKRKVCRLDMLVRFESREQQVKVVCFEEKTNLCQGIKEGDKIIVLGSLNVKSSEVNKPEIEIHARNIIPLSERQVE